MATKLITSEFGVESANAFVSAFADISNPIYLFAGRHIPYPGSDGTVPSANDAVASKTFDIYNNMIFAKRIEHNDVIQVVNRIDWTTNTVYSEYDHAKPLANTSYYVMVNDDEEYNVYKCLFNNNNANSVHAPSRTGSAADLNPIITADGYIWKYMWTITKGEYKKFATRNYVPVIANTDVINNAVPGTIDVIKVLSGGKGYHNHIKTVTFKSGDIEVGGSGVTYLAPSEAVAIDDYYRGCVMKITSGVGVNQYRRIVAYNGSGASKTFILDSEFNVRPQVNDTYEIMPYIYVWGDGMEEVAAEAMAVVDGSANSIVSVEVLNAGRGYRAATVSPGTMPSNIPIESTSVQINIPSEISMDVDFEAANLYPVIAPQYGHGGNPWQELGANKVCVHGRFADTESGLFPTENDFRQIGIIKNPAYANVTLTLENSIGVFSVDEEVYVYNPTKLYGDVTLDNGNNEVKKKDLGLISTTITILNGGTGYDSTANNELVFDNTDTGGSGATATFTNNVSGEITSITVTSQGNNYIIPPTVIVNPTAAVGGSSAQFTVRLANEQETEFDKALNVGDHVIISDGTSKFLSTVNNVVDAYSFTLTNDSPVDFANSHVSKISFNSHGKATSVISNQLTLTNVVGPFTPNSTIVGIDSGATAKISSVVINGRAANTFDKAIQLTRLTGDYTVGGTPFIKDELITQDTQIELFQGKGYLHHIEINAGTDDDTMYISNKTGQFNLDPDGDEVIRGESSSATLENLSVKYPGEFVVDSGKILYYENLGPVTRTGNKSEVVKLIFEF